jgi:hypothetical protein
MDAQIKTSLHVNKDEVHIEVLNKTLQDLGKEGKFFV